MLELQFEHGQKEVPPLYEVPTEKYDTILLFNEEIEGLKNTILENFQPKTGQENKNFLVRGVCLEKGGAGLGIDLSEWIMPTVKFFLKASADASIGLMIHGAFLQIKKRLPQSTYLFEMPVKSYFLNFYFPRYLDFPESQEAYKSMMEVVENFQDSINFAGNHIKYMYDSKSRRWYIDN